MATEIEGIWVAVGVDDDGIEKVVSMPVEGGWVTLMTTHGCDDCLQWLKKQARMAAMKSGRQVKIVSFSQRTVVEVCEGVGGRA